MSRDEERYNAYGRERISERQIDELIGLARGICADGSVNEAEVEFLQKWLAANLAISGHPIIHTLYQRVNDILSDGVVSQDEKAELLDTLQAFATRDFELGETMKPASLPLCEPAPVLAFPGMSYCFTGTFTYGTRNLCEKAILDRGGLAGSLTKKTNYLVVGAYATESWKHSSFGNKIMKAADMRDAGVPISIVSEEHWASFLR